MKYILILFLVSCALPKTSNKQVKKDPMVQPYCKNTLQHDIHRDKCW